MIWAVGFDPQPFFMCIMSGRCCTCRNLHTDILRQVYPQRTSAETHLEAAVVHHGKSTGRGRIFEAVHRLLVAEVFSPAQIFEPAFCAREVLRTLHGADYLPDSSSVFFSHLSLIANLRPGTAPSHRPVKPGGKQPAAAVISQVSRRHICAHGTDRCSYHETAKQTCKAKIPVRDIRDNLPVRLAWPCKAPQIPTQCTGNYSGTEACP